MPTKKQLIESGIERIVKKVLREKRQHHSLVENIDNVSQLYDKYGRTYPYASDAVAYFIFGKSGSFNKITNAIRGSSGRGSEVDESEISEYMLDYEYSWEDNMGEIDEFIQNVETKNGSVLSDYY